MIRLHDASLSAVARIGRHHYAFQADSEPEPHCWTRARRPLRVPDHLPARAREACRAEPLRNGCSGPDVQVGMSRLGRRDSDPCT